MSKETIKYNTEDSTVTYTVSDKPLKSIDLVKLNTEAYAYEIRTAVSNQNAFMTRDIAKSVTKIKLPTNYESRG